MAGFGEPRWAKKQTIFSLHSQFQFIKICTFSFMILWCIVLSSAKQISNSISETERPNGAERLTEEATSWKANSRKSDTDGDSKQRHVYTYREFYTGISDNDVDRKILLDQYNRVLSNLRRVKTIEKSEMEQVQRENIPEEVKLMDRLWSAVNHGRLPVSEELNPGPPIDVQSFWGQVNGELIPGSMLEIGDCVTSFQVAAEHSNVSVLAVPVTETNIPFCVDNAKSGGMQNYHLGVTKPQQLVDTVEELYSDPKVLFGTVLVSNLTHIADCLLPHEMEEFMARLISLSLQTVVINVQSSDTKIKHYFSSQWLSMGTLLERACQIGGLMCTVRNLYSRDTWESRGTVYKVLVQQGVRDMPAAVCTDVAKTKECVLLYSVQSNTTVIQDPSGKTYPVMTSSRAISLDTVLTMNPVSFTKQKLFLQILQLPWLPFSGELSRLIHHLAINGSRLLWTWCKLTPPGYSLSDSVTYGLSETERKVFTTTTRGQDNNPADGINEVEGAALIWERVGDRKPSTIEVEHQQLSDFKLHWEREMLGRGNNPGSDIKELQGVENTWSREQDSNRKNDRMNNAQLYRKDNSLPDDETVLSNNELELQNAMGFLRGKSNVKHFDQRELIGRNSNVQRDHVVVGDYSRVPDGNSNVEGGNLNLPNKIPDTKRDAADSNVIDGKLKFAGGSSNVVDLGNPKFAGGSPNVVDLDNPKLAGGSPNVVDGNPKFAGGSPDAVDGYPKFAGGSPNAVDGNPKFAGGSHNVVDGNPKFAGGSPDVVDGNTKFAGGSPAFDFIESNLKFVGGNPKGNTAKVQKGLPAIRQILPPDLQSKKDELPSNYIVAAVETQVNSHKLPAKGDILQRMLNTSHLPNLVIPPRKEPQLGGNVQVPLPPKIALRKKNITRLKKRDYLAASKVRNQKAKEPVVRQGGERHLLTVREHLPQEYIDRLKKHSAELLDRKSIKVETAGNMETSKMSLVSVSKLRVGNASQTSLVDQMTIKPPAQANKTQVPRVFHRAFSPRRRDHWSFAQYWKIVKKLFVRETEQGIAHFNLLTFGGERQSLLGLKVASVFPASTVISIMPTQSQPAISGHRRTMRTVERENCMLLVSDMIPDLLTDLQQLPELFRFQIIGLEIFSNVISLGESFLYYLGHWLTLAKTTILEVPSPDLLNLAQSILMGNTGRHNRGGQTSHKLALMKGMIHEALRLVGARAKGVRLLEDHHHGNQGQSKLLMVDLETLYRKVNTDCEAKTSELQLRPDGVTYLSHVISDKEINLIPLARAGGGIGLEWLLTVGLSLPERKSLFVMYLHLPVYVDMCPTHIVFFNDTLLYHPVDSASGHLYTNNQGILADQTQTLLRMLNDELGPQPFSFLEYNSREGGLVTALASKYSNSTFVCLEEDIKMAEQLYKVTKDENIQNLVISVLNINQEFTEKLLKSPDFLRYQFLSSSEFVELMQNMKRDQFGQMVGEILATAVSTFIQLPSDEILSLAMTTFFPDSYDGLSLNMNSHEKAQMKYRRESHPLPVYKNAELTLLKQSAHAAVNINISAEVLSPWHPDDSIAHPWRLVRLDIKYLQVQVNHHFDYIRDGHSRKYKQYCVSHNRTSYEVYLVREPDGFKIPYGQLHAFSLIALLRMGLLPQMKTEFYDKFLQLPLYEDMAPWNIVFQAGQLEYIDYDTKDFTFDKMVPAAYQIIAMLMNYERTVKDFGHCKENAHNQYQFKHISHCVGSADYDGPCKDSRYPVPCGDHSCRSTFIECLQVLNDLEKQKTSWKNELLISGTWPSKFAKGKSNVVAEYQQKSDWSFNADGFVTTDKSPSKVH